MKFNPQTFALEVVDVGENGVPESEVLVHDETNRGIAQMLVNLPMQGYPVPLGVIYREASVQSYDDAFWQHHATQGKRTGKVADALRKGKCLD